MASKGPKTGETSAAPKPVARPKKPAAPKAEVAAAKAEKPASTTVAEAPAKPAAPEVEKPAVAVEAAPKEVAREAARETATTAEAVVETTQAAATAPVAAAEAAPEPAKEDSKIMETVEATNKAQHFFADINDRAKAAMEKSSKIVEDMNEFAKGNLEAMVESSRITAKGFESLGQEAAEYSRKSFENATATLKSLASVKSPTEFFKLQSDFVRQSFDSVVAETSKNTEAMLKLAGDAAQPISNRFAVAVEKAKVSA